ncbi:MAG: TRAP transporter large permease subunit, partial [Betaproteobacteria bacterium]
MTSFLAENIGPLMFVGLVIFLLLGYPVAFALSAVGLLFGFIGIQLGLLHPQLLQALPQRVYGIMQNDTLLAIPFFTFMGLVLERSGMAEELLDTLGQLFGAVRGGLAYSVIFVGGLLAATTGVVAASVIAMGLISLPIMLRHGYDKRLATGVIAASGTLAQIIPPSLVLIVMADQLGKSVGDLYRGALVPGLMLMGMYAGYALLVSIFRPASAPALAASARTLRGWALGRRVLSSLIPPVVLIFLVLGTIFLGIATPTEGGAMGGCGALALAALRKRLSLTVLRQAMSVTTKLACFVMFILIGSTLFGLVFRGVNGDLWVEHLLTALPGGAFGFLLVVNAMVFVLAFFLDYFELAFIIVPLLAPVADKLGVDLVWFGVLLSVNMQTSFLHPPFGFALFYLRSVAPKAVKTSDIYWGAAPFVCIQLLMVGLMIVFP